MFDFWATSAQCGDLSAYPGEMVNLAGTRPELLARSADLVRAYASAHREGTDAVIDEELREQLKALGYVE